MNLIAFTCYDVETSILAIHQIPPQSVRCYLQTAIVRTAVASTSPTPPILRQLSSSIRLETQWTQNENYHHMCPLKNALKL